MPKQIIIADSSSIEAHEQCPQLYDFAYRQSLVQIGEAEEKEAITMGTLGHKWLEIFNKERIRTNNAHVAAATAYKFNPDAEDEQDNHQFPLDPIKRKFVYDRCNMYWLFWVAKNVEYLPECKSIHEIGIDESGLPLDCYRQSPLVELGFSYELFNSPEYLFILEGRIDKISSTSGTNCFVDYKFQQRKRNLYTKSIQFRNYAMVTGLNIGIIDYIRLGKEINEDTFVKEVISFNPTELRSWRSELIDIYIQMARELKDTENNKFWSYKRNRAACPGKFGYTCSFAQICEEPNRDLGERIKEQKYVQKKEWKPW